MPAFRVVSLLPGATEIVAALGAGELLVARSHECDYPAEIAGAPAVTAARLDSTRPGAEIERDVKSLLEQALSIYRIDAEKLRVLRPDLIVTQTLCEVCAVSPRDVEQALQDWIGDRPNLLALNAASLDDIFADIARLAAALDRPERGAALIAAMRGRMEAIAALVATARRPRVACIEWISPPMAAGNWTPELVRLAGGDAVLGEAGAHSNWLTLDDVAAADPDIILVFPCGFDLARIAAEMPALTAQATWRTLRAVRAGGVYLIDGNQYLNRPGPRLVESVEILAEIFHPDLFAFGHEGHGWRRYDTTADA